MTVTYDFYVDTYMGSAIPEKAFSGVAARATAMLERLKKICRVTCDGETSEKMAVCAMAETVYAYMGRRPGVSSASLGAASVHYEDADLRKRYNAELYEKAGIYLDIYRGVS
jgi:hypothetical protein